MRLKDKHTGKIKKVLKIVVEKENGYGEVFTSIKDLNEGYEDVPEEKKYGGRVPKEGDTYWVVYVDGVIESQHWEDTESDGDLFECGGAFWTEEEAERELARRKAYVILKEDTKGFKPDWESLDTKWFVGYFRSLGGKLRPDWTQRDSDGVLYFSSMEDAEASIQAHRQEWLDYLGIEDKKRTIPKSKKKWTN